MNDLYRGLESESSIWLSVQGGQLPGEKIKLHCICNPQIPLWPVSDIVPLQDDIIMTPIAQYF